MTVNPVAARLAESAMRPGFYLDRRQVGSMLYVSVNEEYAKVFATEPPARTVTKLGVELPDLLVSIMMIAHIELSAGYRAIQPPARTRSPS